MEISKELFGKVGGKEVYLVTISHSSGACIKIMNYGATWVSALIPDINGTLADVLLGYSTLEGYLSDTNCMGSTVGRFANRINHARFILHDQTYLLDKNDGDNNIHGGFTGFHHQVFDYEQTGDAVVFTYHSPDGEGGFPGNVTVKITYSFSDDLKVRIHYRATTDKDTYLNLTNHAYFNLSGDENILNHQLQISSDKILDTNDWFIPTGEYKPVEGTPFDFKVMKAVGENIHEQNLQLIRNRGYNHCYPLEFQVLKKQQLPAATLSDPTSHRQLKLFTTLPSVLIYTAGFLKSVLPGKSGKKHHPFEGICLEAQFYPDSPNHPYFPTCLIQKNEVYHHEIEFHFSLI